jgi:hypothetical protein
MTLVSSQYNRVLVWLPESLSVIFITPSKVQKLYTAAIPLLLGPSPSSSAGPDDIQGRSSSF